MAILHQLSLLKCRWALANGTPGTFYDRDTIHKVLFTGPMGGPFAASRTGIGGHMWCREGFGISMSQQHGIAKIVEFNCDRTIG